MFGRSARHFRAEEVIVSLPSSRSPEAINALARHHRLTYLDSRSVAPASISPLSAIAAAMPSQTILTPCKKGEDLDATQITPAIRTCAIEDIK
jgi:hypothetical protein